MTHSVRTKMISKELRQKFLDFFKEKGHVVIPSASLVPENDPSVLFTTAGMQQFKPFYTKPEDAPSIRVASIQLCVRTSDIDEVGDDTHLTSFEMLGNFSFGYPSMKNSYFKEEAIKMAWEFLTGEKWLGIDKSRIHATFFSREETEKGIAVTVETDSESKQLLKKLPGLLKIVPQGDDNFWTLGTIDSPGGPTVEFYVDGIEIWNLVFNEMILREDKEGKTYWQGSDIKGVDTGMGLERLLVVYNNRENVYETDLFEPLIKKIEKISGKRHKEYEREFRIIADHIKAAIFLIRDGVSPSNKDQGYVLRRLIRRVIVKGHQIGITHNFTADLAKAALEIYRDTYFNNAALIEEIEKEETKFRRTLKEGLKLLDSYKEIDGKILFDLYQSFGLPSEITLEEAGNRKIKISNLTIEQFNNYLRQHQQLSRTASAGRFKGGLADNSKIVTRYHTATHLLHAALRKVLGDNVFQRGSNITAERIRFDFSHPQKLTPEQVEAVEGLVNEQIKKDLPVSLEEMTLEDARNSGAVGVFESKYGDRVKVYTIGQAIDDYFSREICGGPHVSRTGGLGSFRIIKEEASSVGIRRIKAVLE